jgi:hypothetical protein
MLIAWWTGCPADCRSHLQTTDWLIDASLYSDKWLSLFCSTWSCDNVGLHVVVWRTLLHKKWWQPQLSGAQFSVLRNSVADLCLYHITSDSNTAISRTELQRYVERVLLCCYDAPLHKLIRSCYFSVVICTCFCDAGFICQSLIVTKAFLKCAVNHPFWIVTILSQLSSSPSEYLHDLSVIEHLIVIHCGDTVRSVKSGEFTYSAVLMYFQSCENTWIISISKICTLTLKLWFCSPRVSLV